MTVNGVCHTPWEDQEGFHVCGKVANHEFIHLCACGAFLPSGVSALTEEQRLWRSHPCPICLARAGRPCHTKGFGEREAVMSGVHQERRELAR